MQKQDLAPKAALTTKENPWPLALLTKNIKLYVDRMSELWVEGQVVEYKHRPTTKMAFFVLRDLEQSTSMTVKCFASALTAAGPAFDEGARVVLRCKPDFWEGSGQLSLMAREVHTQGLGDLLARIEQLRQQLEKEGLFSADRKKKLPFLPRQIGLICGRNAKAKDDVINNARLRWPGASFIIHEVAVQGVHCVSEVTAALTALDQIPEVDVIIIARGGGAVEDLLPFSDESLVRQVATAKTPVVSAIGHEADTPLLDYVADYRASTPTDAACRTTPDLAAETEALSLARQALHTATGTYLQQLETQLARLRGAPILSDPLRVIQVHEDQLRHVQETLVLRGQVRINQEVDRLQGLAQTLRAFSPKGVLERGFSILRTPDKQVVTSAADLKTGDLLEAVFATGTAVTKVFGTNPNGSIFPRKEEN